MMANVLDLSGNITHEIELPHVFEEAYRPDLIKRAVLSLQSRRFQPYGPSPRSGMNTSARSWGTNRGVSRVPRVSQGRRAMRVPQAVGGRKAHPPKPEKKLLKKMNKKEYKKAIRSAIAATLNVDLVKFENLPMVVEDEMEVMKKTKEIYSFLRTMNLNLGNKRKIRAGRGKMRGRRYKKRKSILIVVAEDKGIIRAARNLLGMDAVLAQDLNVELLAPGTHAGRFVIWSESAMKKVGEIY
jgi:large subunit ribosomal protein L4e